MPYMKFRRILIPLIVSVSNHRIPILEKEMAAHHPLPFSKHFYTLTQLKAMASSLLLASLHSQREEEEEAKEEGAWIAASAAPWPPCTGFRGTPSALPAMKVPSRRSAGAPPTSSGTGTRRQSTQERQEAADAPH